jgi:quercetin 2,3-dioxygenase
MVSLSPRVTDLGGLTVRRLLPQAGRRLIGPWCFLDVLGPLSYPKGGVMDVPPHPHIGLQTVTWLLEGEVMHRDSLGSEAIARPGTLNLMTSGRGIAHSEETPRGRSGTLHAVQLWVALPDGHRDVEPAFDVYPERPTVALGDAQATVIVGELAGVSAEGRLFSPLVGAEIAMEGETSAVVPATRDFEYGVMPVVGACEVDGEPLETDTLCYLPPGRAEIRLRAPRDQSARLLLIGGAPFRDTIVMWWNFVGRTTDEIVAAREDWQAGRRFGDVRLYDGPRLEAPPFRARPVPANPMS